MPARLKLHQDDRGVGKGHARSGRSPDQGGTPAPCRSCRPDRNSIKMTVELVTGRRGQVGLRVKAGRRHLSVMPARLRLRSDDRGVGHGQATYGRPLDQGKDAGTAEQPAAYVHTRCPPVSTQTVAEFSKTRFKVDQVATEDWNASHVACSDSAGALPRGPRRWQETLYCSLG